MTNISAVSLLNLLYTASTKCAWLKAENEPMNMRIRKKICCLVRPANRSMDPSFAMGRIKTYVRSANSLYYVSPDMKGMRRKGKLRTDTKQMLQNGINLDYIPMSAYQCQKASNAKVPSNQTSRLYHQCDLWKQQ